MNISKTASFRNTPGDFCCPKCGTPLQPQAAFCSVCGERLDSKQSSSSLLYNEQDIASRYRMTTLLRRRPFVTLYFAFDNQQSRQGLQRMVAVRDIDLTSLNNDARVQAIKLVQQEYDSLRLARVPNILPVIDLRYFNGHLYTFSGYPQAPSNQAPNGFNNLARGATGNVLRLYTLQDFLQSGHGLPSEQQAITWTQHLCQAIDVLHQQHIIAGELDPYTIILNENSDRARPALMISWLTPQVQKSLRSPGTSTKFWSYFAAPEALQGKAEQRSDIYSLGAVLYLLLTGSIPSERSLRNKARLRTPRELQSRVSLHVSDCVMQALDPEPSKRFQNALEMSETLSNPRYTRLQAIKRSRPDVPATPPPVVPDEEEAAETVRIVPLSQQHLERWRASHPQDPSSSRIPHSSQVSPSEAQPEEVKEIESGSQQHVIAAPAISSAIAPVSDGTDVEEDAISSPANTESTETVYTPPQNESPDTWFQRFQRYIFGEQQRAMFSAAIIESPISVQPAQVFMLRIQIMGRDEPALSSSSHGTGRSSGLSSLMKGDSLSVQVRAVINQNYSIIVQRAAVPIPQAGYIAEITLPMKPYANLPDGMRERLHISFLDKKQKPLYEKPLLVEVFVSRYAKRGHEGRHVLTIPQ